MEEEEPWYKSQDSDIQVRKIINTEQKLCLLFCMGVNLGLSH